jgi:hypothetical protein
MNQSKAAQVSLFRPDANHPTIREMHWKGAWCSIWLMYVEGVDISKHCKWGLEGFTSNRMTKFLGNVHGLNSTQKLPGRHFYDLGLDESKADAYYICGVAYPLNWEDNFHLAFSYCPGENIIFDERGVSGTILNARRIPIGEIDREKCMYPGKDDPKFYTCRNWQFANMYLRFKETGTWET